MPRGGRRPGAGRKRVLTYRQKIALGAECERRWREEWRKAEKAALAQENTLVRQKWAEAQMVPAAERIEWRQSLEGQDYLEDVRGALQEQQGLHVTVDDDPEPARVRTIRPKRPKGKRARIIESVAREAGVSKRRIEAAWKEFRRLEAEVSEND